jgi:FkbM family methyltransferase
MTTARSLPRPELLHAFYRSTLRLTRKRGMRTFSRMNHWLFPRGQIARLATGCDFYLPPDPHFFGCLVGHEQHIADLIRETVEDGDTCIDVGANIGYFTLMMAARCGPGGRVFAYEPEGTNFAMLEENVALAREQGLSIEATRAAVSGRKGSVVLVRGEESTLHQVRPIEGSDADAAEVVPCVNLAEDLRERGCDGPIKLLKIDVEGHEPEVLRGSIDFFMSGIAKFVVLEVFPGGCAREIAEILEGFDVDVDCWIDGEWRDSPVEEITHLTDILIRF